MLPPRFLLLLRLLSFIFILGVISPAATFSPSLTFFPSPGSSFPSLPSLHDEYTSNTLVIVSHASRSMSTGIGTGVSVADDFPFYPPRHTLYVPSYLLHIIHRPFTLLRDCRCTANTRVVILVMRHGR